MKQLAVLLIAGISFSTVAKGQDQHGPYIGFSVGTLSYEETAGPDSFSDSTTAYRLLGGYRFSDNLALEGAIGSASDLEDSFSISGFTADISAKYDIKTVRVLGLIPLSGVTLLGGVGYYDADVSASVSVRGFGEIGSADDSDSGTTLLGGLEFPLEKVSIRLEYEWFDTDSDIEADDFSISALFRF